MIQDIAHELRRDVARLFYISGSGHFAPALSCVDIFAELFFDGIIDYEKRFTDDRDRVILSKGHAAAALYVTLSKAGFFPREELKSFYQNGSILGGHPNVLLPGVESATGALGHGICFGTGTALAAKLDDKDYHTYVVMGDGESEEGSVWEAAQFASDKGLNNLIVIMDRNRIQASTFVNEILNIEPVRSRWEAFGWKVYETDGHDFGQLHTVLCEAKAETGKPVLIVANTIKGKGVGLSENNPLWHSRTPRNDEWMMVCEELGMTLEELKTI